MRVFVAFMLLMSTFATAHVLQQARRHVVGPRRLSHKLAGRASLAARPLRRRVTQKRSSAIYKAGPLSIAGFEARSLDLTGGIKKKRAQSQHGNNQGGQPDWQSGGGGPSGTGSPQGQGQTGSFTGASPQQTGSGNGWKGQNQGSNKGDSGGDGGSSTASPSQGWDGSDQGSTGDGSPTTSAAVSTETSGSASSGDGDSSASSDSSSTSTDSSDDGDDESCSTESSSDGSDSDDDSDCSDSDSDDSSSSTDDGDAASATSTATASSASSSGSSATTGTTYTGEATYYTQNGNAGACGTVSQDSDKVVALYTDIYANGANCGRMIQITNESGTTIQAKVMDECPTCSDNSHIDLSTGAFDALGSESAGVLSVTWAFVDSS